MTLRFECYPLAVSRVHLRLTAILIVATTILVVAPLAGWPGVMRLPAVLVPAFVLAVILAGPWPETRVSRIFLGWEPARATVFWGAAALGGLLFWVVLTRFMSGEINAVDFTVYFDRPAFQTWLGHPLFVETADLPAFSHRSALAIHAYWAMLPLGLLYGIRASPFWLLGVSVVAVVMGATHVLRIMQTLGAGGVLSIATALAFALNNNTAQMLNYGFHAEVLYAWFIPWLLDAGLRGRRASFLIAAAGCVLVKEDAFLPIFAASVTLGLFRFSGMTWRDRVLFLVAPTVVALIDLAVYYRFVLPVFISSGVPSYAGIWANYGPAPMRAVAGMLVRPFEVIGRTVSSGFFKTVMVPHLFLPLLAWRWIVGIVPIVLLYGASANEPLRQFALYYPVVLVPFLVIGASVGALSLARRIGADIPHARMMASLLVLAGALLVGSTRAGYSLRPWKAEIAEMSAAMSGLAGERVVLVQSGLYAHAGYDARVQLLTPDTLRDPQNAGAAVVLAPQISAYPFRPGELDDLAKLAPLRTAGAGLIVVRLVEGR